jgi:diacylglycerol kinase family enzyme
VDAVVVGDEDSHAMKITLIHNPKAGEGQAAKSIVKLMTDAGHEVQHRSIKKDWQPLLKESADLLVAAGGDGTVRQVALAAAKHGLRFAAIPIGTANNIAKSVGVLGEAAALIESWQDSPRLEQPFDIGEATAPWGKERFIEGVGAGLIGDLISREEEVAAEGKLLGRATDRALHLTCELVRDLKARRWQIRADGEDLSGDYIAVEVLNIRFVGPNLPLAPRAFPGDGLLDVVLVRKDDREALIEYLENRLRLASGQLPKLKCARAKRIEMLAPAGIRWHLDDKNWPKDGPSDEKAEVSVECLEGAVTFVAAAEAEDDHDDTDEV